MISPVAGALFLWLIKTPKLQDRAMEIKEQDDQRKVIQEPFEGHWMFFILLAVLVAMTIVLYLTVDLPEWGMVLTLIVGTTAFCILVVVGMQFKRSHEAIVIDKATKSITVRKLYFGVRRHRVIPLSDIRRIVVAGPTLKSAPDWERGGEKDYWKLIVILSRTKKVRGAGIPHDVPVTIMLDESTNKVDMEHLADAINGFIGK